MKSITNYRNGFSENITNRENFLMEKMGSYRHTIVRRCIAQLRCMSMAIGIFDLYTKVVFSTFDISQVAVEVIAVKLFSLATAISTLFGNFII